MASSLKHSGIDKENSDMKLGFLGTGAITSALITGLSAAAIESLSICVSPRNPLIAADLVNRFPRVSAASSNQGVLEECETVVLAVRPQIVEDVLAELRFGSHHHVISIVSGLRLGRLSQLLRPVTKITRAVPLPLAAQRQSPTAICPADQATADLFALIGTVYPADREEEYSAFCAATSSVASHFAFADCIASWMSDHGIAQDQARDYLGKIFTGLANMMVESPERSLESLTSDFATAGGTNRQILAHLVDREAFKALGEGLDAVLARNMGRAG